MTKINGEADLKAKLAWAYNKIAHKVGKQYSVYRPVAFSDFLDTSNLIGTQNASFTISDDFRNIATEQYQQYIAYLDNLNVQKGDIFNDGNETFVIAWNRGLDLPLAIRSQFLVEIWRNTWDTSSGAMEATPIRVARNVPASFTAGPSVTDFTIPNVRTAAQAPVWEVRIWTHAEAVLPSDMIVRSDGLQLQPINIQNNEHCQLMQCRVVTAHGA